MGGVPRPWCKGKGCVRKPYRTESDYCDDCEKLRHQHQVSHEMEGHPLDIEMCPVCEAFAENDAA